MELQEHEIISLYQKGETIRSLSRLTELSRRNIRNLLIKHQITLKTKSQANRNYQYDETFFERIDTEEKAYWLGFLYADGCIKKRGYVQFALAEEEPVRAFKKSLRAEHPIVVEFNNRSSFNHKEDKLYFLRIGSIHLCQQLIKLGCISHKTLSLAFPSTQQVPLRLLRHFIRGYFDGDGGLGVNNKQFHLSISCTQPFASQLLLILTRFGFNFYLIPDKSIYSIRSHDKSSTIAFVRWLYKNSSYYLKRKKKLAELIYESI